MNRKSNKKASTEFKIILFGIIFMSILNIVLGYIIDPSLVQGYDQQVVIDEILEGFGSFSSFIAGGLLEFAVAIFSIFGVDYILMVTILPFWVLGLFTTFNVILVVSIIFYIIDKIWIG